ncbi:ketohydroxyglutarate aldolase [Paraoerskovia sediminicola]|uniref:Ketohydroxyglutarate aldolase n=1 Tax=Paraoerskovia sediminicola TaxID=1138587 RepID=A0ABN6XE52_9CELL|nr:bifunctional 4-hydroxy-2-oxoglutarate aldolase/2-dehydro-3-deoxy-phosphogluconate aldolase [Paraoerskovia sediminicola]BDZ41957.1 ketohydroxyglutarate aldolase [Paraoerskovia sediminicola]
MTTDRQDLVVAADAAFDTWFAPSPLMAILRGLDTASTIEIAHRAWDLGFGLVEIPVSSEPAYDTLAEVVEEGRRRDRVVGAGTVADVESVVRVRDLGAAFTVAPGWDDAVARASVDADMPHLPGVMTPTDVQAARAAGHRWLKLFPAGVIGPAMITALHGPFPDLRFVATGGVDAGNAGDFLRAGASAVSLSGATRTITPEQIREVCAHRHIS